MLAELSAILVEVGSDHALIGGLAVGYHGRLRATIDVDMLVPRAKLDSYPGAETELAALLDDCATDGR
jgi:hypothetical protein